MDQLTNETRKRSGGDARTPQARLESARREQQIVALRIYDVFYQARLRAQAGDFSQPAIETTVNNGPDHRNGADERDDADNAT